MCIVVPFQRYAEIQVAIPIEGDAKIGFDSVGKVICVFVATIFDSKIINHEAKIDRTCFMLPEYGRTLGGMV